MAVQGMILNMEAQVVTVAEEIAPDVVAHDELFFVQYSQSLEKGDARTNPARKQKVQECIQLLKVEEALTHAPNGPANPRFGRPRCHGDGKCVAPQAAGLRFCPGYCRIAHKPTPRVPG